MYYFKIVFCILRRNDDGSCPIDGYELSITKDLFPDNFTRREIAQQSQNCPVEGCSQLVPLLDIEKHVSDSHKVFFLILLVLILTGSTNRNTFDF